MNLTPEEREIGKENFYAAVGSKLVRAKMLEKTVAGKLASGHGLGAQYFGYDPKIDAPVRIGIIGTGDEGGVLIGALNPAFVQVVAIADIRPYNVYRAFHGDKSSANALRVRPGLMKKYDWATEVIARQHVKIYDEKYEKLLDDPNVEAVIIALPLHLHAEAAIKAMRKGKHVLSEKLMAHSVAQCKEVSRVATETKKLMVVGHQRHYSVLYDSAVEVIKQGLIGEVHHIRAQWHRDNLPGHDSWQPPLPDETMKQQIDSMKKGVAEARTELAKLEGEIPEKLKAGREKLKPSEIVEVEKVEAEMADVEKALASLQKDLASVTGTSPADLSRRGKLAKNLASKRGRLTTLSARRDARLLDLDFRADIKQRRKTIKELSPQIEILTLKYKDAKLGEHVKDFGYEDFQLAGGRDVPAMEELIRWRLWNRTGGGLMAELGSHQLDASGIFVSCLRNDGHKVHPLSVSAVGGRHVFENDRQIDDHVYCSFEYPGPKYDPVKSPEKKIVVTYSSINGNPFGDYGEAVFGTKGTLLLEKEADALLFRDWSTSEYAAVEGDGNSGKLVPGKRGSDEAVLGRQGLDDPISRGYTEEIEHWAWCIRNPGKQPGPRCDHVVALADAVIALTANLAIERMKKLTQEGASEEATSTGGRIDFQPEWFDPASDKTPEGVTPDVSQKKYQV